MVAITIKGRLRSRGRSKNSVNPEIWGVKANGERLKIEEIRKEENHGTVESS